MTVDMISQRDSSNELIGWLREITQHALLVIEHLFIDVIVYLIYVDIQ